MQNTHSDFGVVGKPCPQRLSAKDKDRMDEQRVLAALEKEGLIQRPMSRAAMGVSFDIVDNTSKLTGGVRPPPRLAKLEGRKKKRKKLTEEEINAKLEKAEARRKVRSSGRHSVD